MTSAAKFSAFDVSQDLPRRICLDIPFGLIKISPLAVADFQLPGADLFIQDLSISPLLLGLGLFENSTCSILTQLSTIFV